MKATVAFYSLGGVLAPLLMGWIVGATEEPRLGYSQGFLWMGAAMCLGAVLLAPWIRPERDAARLRRLAERDEPGPAASPRS
ncbi:hypothetical protein AB0I53_46950 [Saccharopolyspora sp. NPDC050389]|uniref:hypothetical protein n=1 Tax=Saccharopolyspora sp. NPDC050389 TaxID=3155516 RepID=UPI0033FDD467